MERLLGGRSRAERLGDAALVLTLAIVGLAGHLAAVDDAAVEAAPITPGIGLLAMLAPNVIWWRRGRPLAMFALLLTLSVVAAGVADGGLFSFQIGLVIMVMAHAVGAWSHRLVLGGGLIALLLVLVVAGSTNDGNSVLAGSALGVAMLAFPFALGLASRQRRQYLHEVEQRLAEAERDRDERARRAIEQERTRIARELHDVVAHHVSLIGVQAGAARAALDTSPEATRRALSSIEASSRDAVGEMRRLLDVLRPIDGSGEVEPPQPGLERLPELVAGWSTAGTRIQLDADDAWTDVPPAVSSAGYRIIEEALTNVARHSAAQAASVVARVDGEALVVGVSDPGPPASLDAEIGSGRGLTGMRERVRLFGGTFQAGPTPDGGFGVHARLPVRA